MEGNCRADVHDASVSAWAHVGQRHARAVNSPMIRHIGHSLKFRFGYIAETAIDAVSGAVDPHVDRTELGDDGVRGSKKSGGVRYVRLGRRRTTSGRFYVLATSRQPFRSTRDEAHAPTAPGKQGSRTATDAGRSPRDHDETWNRPARCRLPRHLEAIHRSTLSCRHDQATARVLTGSGSGTSEPTSRRATKHAPGFYELHIGHPLNPPYT